MAPQPLYRGANIDPAYCLRYSWTGWPTGSSFKNLPGEDFLKVIAPEWEDDGLRLLENYWSDEKIQLTFSTKPTVAPFALARCVKGRLNDALRKAGHPQKFSRKLSVRSVGDNTTKAVEEYIKSQVTKELFIDPVFAEKLKKFTVSVPDVDLSVASQSARGCYWYNLHLVLVVVERLRIVDFDWLATIRDGCFRIASAKGHHISTLSVMPDHLHAAMRGNLGQSPQDIALAFQNNLAYLLGQKPVWCENFYVGTFTEYDMWAIRHKAVPAR